MCFTCPFTLCIFTEVEMKTALIPKSSSKGPAEYAKCQTLMEISVTPQEFEPLFGIFWLASSNEQWSYLIGVTCLLLRTKITINV